MMVAGLQPAGLPHSDMLGSIPVCRSPSLFAAYHVLHRLRIAKASSVRSLLLSFLSCESAYRMISTPRGAHSLGRLLLPLKLQSLFSKRKNPFKSYRLSIYCFTSLIFSLNLVNELFVFVYFPDLFVRLGLRSSRPKGRSGPPPSSSSTSEKYFKKLQCLAFHSMPAV